MPGICVSTLTDQYVFITYTEQQIGVNDEVLIPLIIRHTKLWWGCEKELIELSLLLRTTQCLYSEIFSLLLSSFIHFNGSSTVPAGNGSVEFKILHESLQYATRKPKEAVLEANRETGPFKFATLKCKSITSSDI